MGSVGSTEYSTYSYRRCSYRPHAARYTRHEECLGQQHDDVKRKPSIWRCRRHELAPWQEQRYPRFEQRKQEPKRYQNSVGGQHDSSAVYSDAILPTASWCHIASSTVVKELHSSIRFGRKHDGRRPQSTTTSIQQTLQYHQQATSFTQCLPSSSPSPASLLPLPLPLRLLLVRATSASSSPCTAVPHRRTRRACAWRSRRTTSRTSFLL